MGKNIVICFDGTGNDFSGPSSNVLKTYRLIIKDAEQGQVAFYDPGVGTVSTNNAYTAVLNKLIRWRKAIMGGAFGLGVKHNIGDAYHYLMNCYVQGDKVFIFGFSRGAYTARAFAGMLKKCGLLHKRCENLLPYAEKIYFDKNNKEEAENFRSSVSRVCTHHLVGVWDTVSSIGRGLSKRTFFDADLNPDVKVGLHAISIDETRKKFPISLWAKSKNPKQILKQVWFAGVHSDVGGGYPETGLSDFALSWMLNEARDNGLKIHSEWGYEVMPYHNAAMHESREGFWKIWSKKPRIIQPYANVEPSADNPVLIHESVYLRMNKKSGIDIYKPTLPIDQYVEIIKEHEDPINDLDF